MEFEDGLRCLTIVGFIWGVIGMVVMAGYFIYWEVAQPASGTDIGSNLMAGFCGVPAFIFLFFGIIAATGSRYRRYR